MGGAVERGTGEDVPLLHSRFLAGRGVPYGLRGCARRRNRGSGRRTTGAAADLVSGQQIVQSHSAAHVAARNTDLVAARQREQEKPRMFEGNAGGHMQLEVRLVGLTEQDARLQRSDAIPRLEPGFRTTQESVYDVETRQLRGLKVEFAIPEEKGRLARRLAAMPGEEPCINIHHVAADQ